jgi:hypothetical protein
MNIFRRKPTLYFVLAVVMISLAVIVFVSPVSAGGRGATQISGTGYIVEPGDDPGNCDLSLLDETNGPHFAIRLEGDLVGCNYVTVLDYAFSPSGTYRERGTEFYDISGGEFGIGTFETTYLATIKWDENGGEIWGRCQHPIEAGTGTGDFMHVTGRLDYKDNVSDGVFIDAPYRGHLRWP